MSKKKKLGIIGGMGSRAGSLFLQRIIEYSPAEKDQEFLEIIFHNNSNIPDRTRAIVYGEVSPLSDILKSIALFNENQVEVIALACITSYYYYNEFSVRTNAKIMNPLDLLGECIRDKYQGVEKIGLLATTGTIRSGLFHHMLDGLGIDIVTLEPDDQEEIFMRSVYMKNGFKSAFVSQEAAELMIEAFKKVRRSGADLIIGGCTEVSLGIRPDMIDFPYIDTLDLLAQETVDCCYHSDLVIIK